MKDLRTIFILCATALKEQCVDEAKKPENRFAGSEWVMKNRKVKFGTYHDTVWNTYIGGWDHFYEHAKNCRESEVEEMIRDMEAYLFQWAQDWHDLHK